MVQRETSVVKQWGEGCSSAMVGHCRLVVAVRCHLHPHIHPRQEHLETTSKAHRARRASRAVCAQRGKSRTEGQSRGLSPQWPMSTVDFRADRQLELPIVKMELSCIDNYENKLEVFEWHAFNSIDEVSEQPHTHFTRMLRDMHAD